MPAYPNFDFVGNIGFDWSNERIRTSVNSVEALHRSLYLEANAIGGDSLDFYLAPNWPQQELVAGSYVSRDHFNTTSKPHAFVNFVLDYIAKQRSFWWYGIPLRAASDFRT